MEAVLCVVLLAVVILLLNAGLYDSAPCSCATTEPPTVEPPTCVYYLRSQYITCGGEEGSASNGVTCDTSVTSGRHNLTAGIYRYRKQYLYKLLNFTI